ncbi:hypothetical protein Fmac_031722 [Flemingia macrophylla]|uniref:Uncharacterized protein n=1 Tax=Flemingia macrophylla TaxID=520843 RepID=A0ABD1L2V9_9FABA
MYHATSSLVQLPSGGFCESASDPWKFIESNNNAPNSSEDAMKHDETPENQTGPSDNGESQTMAKLPSLMATTREEKITWLGLHLKAISTRQLQCPIVPQILTGKELVTLFAKGGLVRSGHIRDATEKGYAAFFA